MLEESLLQNVAEIDRMNFLSFSGFVCQVITATYSKWPLTCCMHQRTAMIYDPI